MQTGRPALPRDFSLPENNCGCRRAPAKMRRSRPGAKLALAPLRIERCQALVCNRPPPVGIEPQQMAVAGNAVEQLRARAAARRRTSLIIAQSQGFVPE